MKQIAVVVAAAFMLALVAPAFAQPFADVPTNHWAYDAIAELAAKGLIEGYPDGTFKGDRAMTRYEMAMVVARLLARIESIQIPAPAAAPAPQVTRADLAALQRLINEFRAELAALGVRVTAIEEELNAIKARLDNVRITGRIRVRYDAQPMATGSSLNGNPNAFGTDSSNTAIVFRARMGYKLIFDGTASPEISARLAIENTSVASSTPLTFNSGNYGTSNFGSGTSTAATSTATSPSYVFAGVSEAFLTWSNAWGTGLNVYLGRMGYGQLDAKVDPSKVDPSPKEAHNLIFGPHGLLLNTTSSTYGASSGNGGTHMIDGIHLSWGKADWADFKVQAALWRVAGSTGSGGSCSGSSGCVAYFLGEDAYGVDANIRLFPGLRLGGYLVGNSINPAQPLYAGIAGAPNSRYHVYGNAGTPGTNPTTANCSTAITSAVNSVQTGIACPAAGSGVGGYVQWEALSPKIITFDGEFASWNDNVTPTSDSGYWANITWDLGTLLGAGHKLMLKTSYIYAGVNFYPPYAHDIDDDITQSVFPGNAQGFNGHLTFDLTDAWGITAAYFTGNNVSNGQGILEYKVGVTYRFAPSATLYTRIENQRINNVSQYTLYRSELNYTF